MSSKVTLTGARLVLRPPRIGDAEERLALGNAPEIMRMFGVDPATLPIFTIEAARKDLQRVVDHPHAWVIEHDGKYLGEVRLHEVDRHDRRARLAIALYDLQKLGGGLGREAVGLVLAHAFGPLDLHRVSLRVIAYNERAIRCYRACGFKEEGREREAACVAGQWHDDVMMGVLASDRR
jgi:RimJ/RimL family protein N-acetyltransferase